MTGPTPDFSGNIAPGLYHAEGDPPGTVRQWDGTQWVGSPMPAPAGSTPATVSLDDFAGPGVRLGAILIDGIFFLVCSILVTVPFLEDTDPDSSSIEFEVTGLATYVGPLIVLALTILLVATKGGSPGKLLVGLRVTTQNGTTPPGYGPAVIRSLLWVPTLIPLLGILVWLVVVIGSLIMISTDPERRSMFDRVANTRVIRT